MSDNPVLEHLRHIRGAPDAPREDMRDVKHRLTTLEIQVTNLASTETSHCAAWQSEWIAPTIGWTASSGDWTSSQPPDARPVNEQRRAEKRIAFRHL